MAKKWYTNDITEIQIEDGCEIPKGYHKGRKPRQKGDKHLSEETRQKISIATKGRIPYNKGKKEEIKHCYYTNGQTNIRIPFDKDPPEGFYRGRVRNYSEESKRKQAENAKKTKQERYGNSKYNNTQKNKLTKLIKYGNEYYNNREGCVETCLKKYGVDNVSKVPEIATKAYERAKKTTLERYGVENILLLYYGRNSKDSKPNIALEEYLTQNNINIDCREFILGNYRYDFKVGNNLIEVDPYPYHNATWGPRNISPKSKDYHSKKTEMAKENGYRCIHIWDWDDIDKIIKLLKNREVCYARDCNIKEITKTEAKKYLEENHLQGYARDEIRIGLYNNEELVSVMTFGKPRYNKKYDYELIRYCSHKYIIGGAEKLFKYFLRQYNPNSIISYCDYSKFDGKVYNRLGFKYQKTTICKHWYNYKTKRHITDNLLRQRGFDQLLGSEYGIYGKGTSNEELMKAHNFVEIYDAGQATYIWEKKN